MTSIAARSTDDPATECSLPDGNESIPFNPEFVQELIQTIDQSDSLLEQVETGSILMQYLLQFPYIYSALPDLGQQMQRYCQILLMVMDEHVCIGTIPFELGAEMTQLATQLLAHASQNGNDLNDLNDLNPNNTHPDFDAEAYYLDDPDFDDEDDSE